MTYPALNLTQRQLIILRIVWTHGPASGSDLIEPVDDALGSDRLGDSLFYDNLGALVDAGYVEVRKLDGRTNEYACTHEGTRLLWDVSAWLVDDR